MLVDSRADVTEMNHAKYNFGCATVAPAHDVHKTPGSLADMMT